MSLSEKDFEGFASMLEELGAKWDSLDAQQKDDLTATAQAALSDAGDWQLSEGKSEFERNGAILTSAGSALQLAGVGLALTVVGAPFAAAVGALGTVWKWMGRAASQLTIERTVALGLWLSTRTPKFYGMFCDDPSLFYGMIYNISDPNGFYLISSCPWYGGKNSGIATTLGIVTGDASDMAKPPWSVSSSDSSSSGYAKWLLAAGAAWALFK